MLLKLFKGTGPGIIIFIFLVLVLLWINALVNPIVETGVASGTDQMPLYLILDRLTGNSLVSRMIFTLFLLSLMAFLMVNLNTSVIFINERTFLPAVLYILFSALFIENQIFNPVLPAAVLLMMALRRILDAYRKPGTAFNFFDAGVLIGTAALFYANVIWFGIILIIGIAILRTGNIKEILISLLGMVTPLFLTAGIYYVTGKPVDALVDVFRIGLFGHKEGYDFHWLTTVVLIFSGIIIVASTGFLIMQMNNKKIKTRKTFYLLLWILSISIILYFVSSSVSVEIVWIAAIPMSYLITHYFIFSRRKLITEIFFSGMFLLILVKQLLYLLRII